MMGHTVRDVLVWQRAIALAVCIHELTREFPYDERYGMTAQMRRTSISVASNIAEGRQRADLTDFHHFLGLAQSSIFELKTQLLVAGQLGMADSKAISFAASLSEDISKMLAACMRTLNSGAGLSGGPHIVGNSAPPLIAQA